MKWVVFLLLVGGCSSDLAARYLGAWTYVDGTVTTACTKNDITSSTDKMLTGGVQTITRGTRADLATTDTGCPVDLRVYETGADLVPTSAECIVGGVSTDFTFYRLQPTSYYAVGATTPVHGLASMIEATATSDAGQCQITASGILTLNQP